MNILPMLPKDFNAQNFVGREAELGFLKNITSEAKAGDANSIFLSGKRGIGKTELLKYLYSNFFDHQNDAIPLFYTVKSSVNSIEKFSKDYFYNFVLQSLAFLNRDRSIMLTGIHSAEDLKSIAKGANVQWAVDIIDNFLVLQDDEDIMKLFLFAISAPYQNYARTGMPLVVIIDDFDKIRKICDLNATGDKENIWILFENYLQSGHTPHIIAGVYSDLREMFFEETAMGESLEVINLSGLTRDNSSDFFKFLCNKYTLDFGANITDYLDLFDGNPFYIRSFVQAVRQANMPISENNFWDIYVREVTRGKIYMYWMALLKTHIAQFEMRKPSLNFLRFLLVNETDIVLADLSEKLSVEQDELDNIINQLNSSGAVDIGFSTLELEEDAVLIDVIKGLYHKEIRREPYDIVKDLIIADKRQTVQAERTPSFDITIPPDPNAELVAVKALEEIARHYNIRPDKTGQLQIALIELFANILIVDGYTDNYYLKFKLLEDKFSIEIETEQSDLDIFSDSNRKSLNLVKSHIDEINAEKTVSGSRITLIKVVNQEPDSE
jgi:AAA+ ATPase superfamily predicted ATPase